MVSEYFSKPVFIYVNKTNITLLYHVKGWIIKISFWFWFFHKETCWDFGYQHVMLSMLSLQMGFDFCKLNSFRGTILVLGTKDELRSDWWSGLMNTNICIIVTVNLHWQTLRVETMLNGKIRDPNMRLIKLKHKTQRKVSLILRHTILLKEKSFNVKTIDLGTIVESGY